MSDIDLSIIIPARNEMFLKNTIEDILANIEGRTEIIVLLDGALANPPISVHPLVTVIYRSQSIGQRAACNECAKLARGKYIMKVDAHCAFDKGFDVKMMADMQDDWTAVPLMKNLHVFDWVCPDGHRRYQGPSGDCKECGKATERDIVWVAKKSPNSRSYCFDAEPHFQYFAEFSKRPEGQGEITDTLSLQGSCFMMTRKKFFELTICDESYGSWGSQGIEVALKTWLSGGRVVCNTKTWYAHLFRTQGGDFSFPYPQSGKQIDRAKKGVRDLFFQNKMPGQKMQLHELLEKFWPVPGWTDAQLAQLKQGKPVDPHGKTSVKGEQEIPKEKKPSKGVVYYTHNQRAPEIFDACQKQILKGIKEKHVVSVSTVPINFGGTRLIYDKEVDVKWLDMFEKILMGLKASKADVIFFCEDDVLYHPSHFDFVPPRKDAYYYNTNMWKLRYDDGHCLYVDDCKQLSGICAWRETLIAHYEERVRRVKLEGHSTKNGFEPGTRHIANGGYDNLEAIERKSEFPIIDIRHGTNSTQNRWRKDQFRNQKYTKGWTEAQFSAVEGWEGFEFKT